MPNPKETIPPETKKTIKALRTATTAFIYALRKPSKSMWFPDIETASTVAETKENCLKALDEAIDKFVK